MRIKAIDKKILLVIIIVLFLSTFTFAQKAAINDTKDIVKNLKTKAKEIEATKKYDEAISSYQKAIELEPANYYLYYKVGELYENLSREHKYDFKKANDIYDPMDPYLEKAIEYYQKGLDLLPEDKKAEESPLGGLWWSYQIPFISRLTGNFSKELAFYKKNYETDPGIKKSLENQIQRKLKKEDYLRVGELYCQLGQYKEAISCWQKGFQERKIREADIIHANHYGDFISYVGEKFLKDHPNDLSAKYVLASVYRILGENEKTIKLIQSMPAKDGFSYKEGARDILGALYQRNVVWANINTVSSLRKELDVEAIRQNADQVISDCEKAIELGAKDEEAYWILGEGYYLKKEYPKAIEAGLQSGQIKPNYYPAFHLLIRSYSCNEEYEKALDACLKATEVFSSGISVPHLSYFYSLCRRLIAADKYETALSYYKKLLELSSRIKIDNKYLNDSNYFDLQREISHVQHYINSPIKSYPPKLKFKKLTPEERQIFRVSLGGVKVSQSSENITVYATSAEKIDPYMSGEGKPWISWWGAIGGTSGRIFLTKFEFEYKGVLKSAMIAKRVGKNEFRIDSIPDEFRNEVIATREKAMMEYLRKTKDYFQISEDIIENLLFDKPNNLYVYSTGSLYKGLPLKEDNDSYFTRNFTVHLLDKYAYDRENCFEISNSLYSLPDMEIPTNPLISEEEAKKIGGKALEEKFKKDNPSVSRERSSDEPYPVNVVNNTTIGKIELCIQPQVVSFGDMGYLDLSLDLFDPLYNFVEYRLVWLASNESERYLVKIDAITGEILLVRYTGPIE